MRAARLLVAALALTSVALPLAQAAAPAPPAPGMWVAGDLHVHTVYGHDTCTSPTEAWDPTSTDRAARRACRDPWTLSFTPRERLEDAEQRGLDFLALTDHANVIGQTDPGFTSYAGPVMKVPGYENSQPGHVQMLGARSCYGNDGAVPEALVDCGSYVTDQSAAGEQRMADGLRADGGAFQINHPSDRGWSSRYGRSVVPDTMEVWNIGGWWFQNPLPAANDNDASLEYYDSFLREGAQIGATGGSDSHWQATNPFQGVGEPTTWVWVTERSPEAVLAGLRAHRTTVSMEPPTRKGPRLYLEADADRDGRFEAMVGDSVAPGARFRVRAENALPGGVLRLVTEQGFTEVPMTGATYDFDSPAGVFLRAELRVSDAQSQRVPTCDPVARALEQRFGSEFTYCRNRLVMQALTSPIYVRVPQVATALSYTGPTATRGSTAALEATLTAGAAPLAGQSVQFTVSGTSYDAVTDGAGVARSVADLVDHGKSQQVTVTYAGSERYLPSSTTAVLTWGRSDAQPAR